MSVFSSYKKIFLLGFITVILLAIPFSVYIAQKRQNISSKAAPSTSLSFSPPSATIKVGDPVSLDVWLNPGTNQVSFVKLSISIVDPAKFTIVSLTENKDGNALSNIVDAPQYDNTAGTAKISLSIGADPAEAIKVKTRIATLQLKATAAITPPSPNVKFEISDMQVLSIAIPDSTSENVLLPLSSSTPATVTVTSIATGVTPTSTPTPTPAPTRTPIGTTPTVGTGTGTTPTGTGTPPVCSSLDINGLTNGTAPYPLTFTATGNDSDGTISKISFNFGDSIEDLTGGGGIGTSSVSGQLLHAYKTPGVYTAYAILTDNNNNLSAQRDSCTKIITISSDLSQTLQLSPTVIVQAPPCVDPACGDIKTTLGLGTLGIIFTIIGGALLFL